MYFLNYKMGSITISWIGFQEKAHWSVTHFPFWVDEICHRQTHIHQKPKAY
jgi:hypothetical protein